MVYKLHLTSEKLDMLKDIMEGYDWFCDCPNFPNCDDFRKFKRLKKQVENLEMRHFSGSFSGRTAHRLLKSKYILEGANMGREIAREQIQKERERQEKTKQLSG